jgi:CTP synthase
MAGRAKGEQKRDDTHGQGRHHAPRRAGSASAPNTLARSIYGDENVFERHRHRYEFNNGYRDRYTQSGFRSRACRRTTWSRSSNYPGTRGSSPRSSIRSSPPRRVTAIRCSRGFVKAARQHRTAQLPEVASA